ncbi:MAG: acetyl esterase/lipase [Verrucomicrobiales bacterium]|jgi:acetyl esterase/lipase
MKQSSRPFSDLDKINLSRSSPIKMKNSPLRFSAAILALASTAIGAEPEIEIVKNVAFLGADRAQKLDLYLPPDSGKPRPAILIVHGGGWHGGDKAAGREINIGTNLAKAGFVCASVNYVLAEKKESFVDNLRQVWPRNLQECMTAVKFLRANAEKFRINPDKIGAIGGSAGGHLVAMLAYASDDDGLDPKDELYGDHSCRIQAVVPMYGVYDLLQLAERRKMLAELSEEDKALCRAASAVSYLDASDPPALLLHGTRDPLVPLAQSERLNEALTAAKLTNELHVVNGGKHSFHLEPAQEDLRPLVIEFFNRHLK